MMKNVMKRSVIIFGLVGIAAAILFRSCILSDDEIVASDWKYADEASQNEPAELLIFRSGGDAVLNDTVYDQGRPIAVVEWAYHKYEGTDRLFIRSLASGRSVEYIDF